MFVKIGGFVVNTENVNYFLVAPVSAEYSHLMIDYRNGEVIEVFIGTHADAEAIANRLADELPYLIDLNNPNQPKDDLPF